MNKKSLAHQALELVEKATPEKWEYGGQSWDPDGRHLVNLNWKYEKRHDTLIVTSYPDQMTGSIFLMIGCKDLRKREKWLRAPAFITMI